MAKKQIFSQSQLPVRRSSEFLPQVFRTDNNAKFFGATLDALIQPGVLQKLTGYMGRRYGKTYNSKDIYLDEENNLRSKYQLEPGVIVKDNQDNITDFYDYLDFINQIKFFGNNNDRQDLQTEERNLSWSPPICWDKFTNFREYYWVPDGPPSVVITGQARNIISTYKVRTAEQSVYILYPDGLTNNPEIILYRGQTYKFEINAPRDGFNIRTSFIEGASSNYNKGVTNNGIEVGTLTFEVPLDAPDVLFYQSSIDLDRLGKFVIADVSTNTFLDIEKDILGKTQYNSSNDIEFTNGMMVNFSGQVTPTEYSRGDFIVEGVGKGIRLVRFSDLEVPVLDRNAPEILFDNEGFDTLPFDDASAFPLNKDYITINRASKDYNAWSRYNRWFHRSVLEFANSVNGSVFDLDESSRAKRPIIEFDFDLQLYNHGSVYRNAIDFIDDFTKDVFSTIEGSSSYIIDGEPIFNGAKILVTADTDSLVKNKIYTVNFISTQYSGVSGRQISLIEDTSPVAGQCVLIRKGKNNRGAMYHYTGSDWLKSQEKTGTNVTPKFDIFDSGGVSFGNLETYEASTFTGSEIVSYKVSTNGIIDTELGFKLSYLNIENVGDIEFEFDFDKDTFHYQSQTTPISVNISSGFYRKNVTISDYEYGNCWISTDKDFLQPIVDSKIISEVTKSVTFTSVIWKDSTDEKIIFYKNGFLFKDGYVRSADLKTFTFTNNFSVGDVLTIKIFTDAEPDTGYYEIPLGLERNPLNQKINSFTLGQTYDHVSSMVEIYENFDGLYPGVSNLRDIDNFQKYGRRFVKHTGVSALALSLLVDKEINLIKAIQATKEDYRSFRNNFLNLAITLPFDLNVVAFVDSIISTMSQTKSATNPYADSDMIGSGAYTSVLLTIEDPEIVNYSINLRFDLNSVSRQAVYAYRNNVQLLYGRDYTFDKTFAFIKITAPLAENDVIEIREYTSTSFSFIPPTPTKLGLYKKYTPKIYIDNTFVTPTKVIQGHDGSLTVAFNDFRDDLLLELEKRIFNNLKQTYDETIFDLDEIEQNYYGSGIYNKNTVDSVLVKDFLSWLQNTNTDFITNSYFDTENSFTYTYNRMTDPTQQIALPGYWRGVYRWFYGTDRPHRSPWEMLGFTEEPSWWEDEYGSAPYTSGNLLLWEDIRDGIIRQGSRAGQYDKYKRPTILNYLPVDDDGTLLSPLESNLAQDFSLISARGNFVFGDVGPAEAAWRHSTDYPFSIISTICLLRPFDFIPISIDRSRISRNILGQIVNSSTNEFITITDIKTPEVGSVQTSGLIDFLSAFVLRQGLSISTLSDKLQGIDVRISNRLSGFVDKEQQKYLLDSKSPSSSSSSIFIPQENYDVIFNVSSPIYTINYSGMLIEKVNNGFKIQGYDKYNPFFNYYAPITSEKDPLITVGGVSATFIDWTPEKFIQNGQIVRYNGAFYRSNKTHTTELDFDSSLYTKIPNVPIVGAREAFKRRTFNKSRIETVAYGTVYDNIQSVVDLMLGYEQYLISQGVVFDVFDKQNNVVNDWFTAAKEFMFWTKHNWAEGSLLSVSPAANKLQVNFSIGAVDNLYDSFYEYSILKADGKPLSIGNLNVYRDYQTFSLTTADTVEGIYFATLNFVLKEHVTIFDDRTVFNDVIYDKPTGYRQDRMKIRGFRTTDWDGDYTSPGFLFDNVNIDLWQPYRDYKLGDIVKYREYYWTSLISQTGTEVFDDTNWQKLDSTPVKQLVPNFDYKINQFDDYFDLDADGVDVTKQTLARHYLGYQSRQYLENLSEDPVTQFKLYQGFIREKGTKNSVSKVFDKLSRTNSDSIEINEEWAFRVGQFGGSDQFTEVEFRIDKEDIQLTPQPLIAISGSISPDLTDRYLRINESAFTISPIPFTTDLAPTKTYDVADRTAGPVKLDQIEHVVKDKSDLLNLEFSNVKYNDHVWVTFDGPTWGVLRYSKTDYFVLDVDKVDDLVRVTLNGLHDLIAGEIVGIDGIENLTGFFEILEVDATSFLVGAIIGRGNPSVEDSSAARIGKFITARFESIDALSPENANLLSSGARLWIDHTDDNTWKVYEKIRQYIPKEILDYGITTKGPSITSLRTGTAVAYSAVRKQSYATIPGASSVVVYKDTPLGLSPTQILTNPVDYASSFAQQRFGDSIAVSPDGRWLVVGSSRASGLKSQWKGIFSLATPYNTGDIVLFEGKLYRATKNTPGDGSSINIYTEDWTPATLLEADSSTYSDSAKTEQGAITLYEWYAEQWNFSTIILSPRPSAYEFFGKAIAIGKSGSNYYMAVSATGFMNNSGRVYLFKYSNNDWSIIEDPNYLGIYNPSKFYPTGSIVWSNGNLWKALADNPGDGSSVGLSVSSNDWVLVEDVPTQCMLPTNISSDDSSNELGIFDDSTAIAGLYLDNQQGESVNTDDRFGQSISMSQDGVFLAVGIPYSDGQWFANFKGQWNPYEIYSLNDVVLYNDLYYKLISASSTIGLDPSTSSASQWQSVGDSSISRSGKVIIYKRSAAGSYNVYQTIANGSLSTIDISERYSTLVTIAESTNEFTCANANGLINNGPVRFIGSVFGGVVEGLTYYVREKIGNRKFTISSTVGGSEITLTPGTGSMTIITISTRTVNEGDNFGFSISFDSDARSLLVSAPNSDGLLSDQGTVYRLTRSDTENEFQIVDRYQSYSETGSEQYGSKVSFSSDATRFAIGARNSTYKVKTRFDSNSTTFDQASTLYSEELGNTGSVYVYELIDGIYVISEVLEAEFISNESFGQDLTVSGSVIVVGSPTYREADTEDNNEIKDLGKIRKFTKADNVTSINLISEQKPLVDLSKLKSISVYDVVSNLKLADVDVIDHWKLKISGKADQEIKFKTPYDPASYMRGTESQVIDPDTAWFEKNVGILWWDVSAAKWIYHEQGEIDYRIGHWNQLAEGASIDIYEWVETNLLPSEWSILADTTEGLTENISGQPLYPDDTVYNSKEIRDTISGQVKTILYYYWVKNKTTVPANLDIRKISSAEVANYIINPLSTGEPFAAFIDKDTMLLYNFNNLLPNDYALINLQFYNTTQQINLVHNEYQLLTEGVEDSLPAAPLEQKWIDSLIGYDRSGNQVPDPSLAPKQRYGISYRPRQSMFVDRNKALEIVITKVNNILLERPFAESISLDNLNKIDPVPEEILNHYDVEIESELDLETIKTQRLRQAVLTPVISDGKINSIIIVDAGYGYRANELENPNITNVYIGPPVSISGNGTGATAQTFIDIQGRVIRVDVLTQGKKYTSAACKVRPFSVLVDSDTSINGFWSIYGWDQLTKSWYRTATQAFDTSRYWSYIDWWSSGYSSASRINFEIDAEYLEPISKIKQGELLKVKEYATGGWAVFKLVNTDAIEFSNKYEMIGRQNGTIELSRNLYDTTQNQIGFDNTGTYDSIQYDLQPTAETRNILTAVKEDIFVNDYAIEWNKLFFSSISYVFSEQLYVDWAFKTSFIQVKHTVGDFDQRINYKNDSLDSYEKYLEEVKPYRTKIREYTSSYGYTDRVGSALSDFDLPAYYDRTQGDIIPVNENNDLVNNYPWKSWKDDHLYQVTEINVIDSGANYTNPPTVIITGGGGTDASARAFISNGRVSGIVVTSPGKNYTSTPSISLVGGNGSNISTAARAVSRIGNSKSRSFDLTLKFDRISQRGLFTDYNYSQTIVGTRATASYELDYAPTRDKSKITITRNGDLILSTDYNVEIYSSTSLGFTELKGKVIFNTAPQTGDVIVIEYEKNMELFDSIDRINQFYAPTDGMLGKDPALLMTGLDFGGVEVQGNTFAVTGGWDALPWYSDAWDSVEDSGDFYYQINYSIYDQSETYRVGDIVEYFGQRFVALEINNNRPPDEFPGTWDGFVINLGFVPAAGDQVHLYFKSASSDPNSQPVRIDDPNFGTPQQTNPNAIISTIIGDGSSLEITIPAGLATVNGDILIFRKPESDGAVRISDPNILDTVISGGDLTNIAGAYSTANGLSAEDISIDGGKFISPESTPAPEENVPGQVLDSYSIKVFTTTTNSSPSVLVRTAKGNGTTTRYSIGQKVLEAKSILVYVNKVQREFSDTTAGDFDIDWITGEIVLVTPPPSGSDVEIISFGIGGLGLLDFKEYISDGNTRYFLTDASYSLTDSIIVTVDGIETPTNFINSRGVVNNKDNTLIDFGLPPDIGRSIKILVLTEPVESDSSGQNAVRVNQQVIFYDGSTRSFDLDRFVNLERSSSTGSLFVELNNTYLKSVDTVYQVYDGNNNTVNIGIDPEKLSGAILIDTISVFVNERRLGFVTGFTFSGDTNTITVLESQLSSGDVIKVTISTDGDYSIVNNNLILNDSLSLSLDDRITVTWFSEYPSTDLVKDLYEGGKVKYRLQRSPISVDYVWVYKNGNRLIQDKDYGIQGLDIYLRESTLNTDVIEIASFGRNIYSEPIAYEISKDMFNMNSFKRYVINEVELTQELKYYDTDIFVNDASQLPTPKTSVNLPGIILINGERIEYFIKDGNKLSQLRRGFKGTAISETHAEGSKVIDVSAGQDIPYAETQNRQDLIADGSSKLLIGLDFIPTKASRVGTWTRNSIPADFGPCDQIEVFIGGRRLRKDPISIYNEDNGYSSPSSDETVEAEFSVDGFTNGIRLTDVYPAGTRIIVIRRLGKTWYDQGISTASAGRSLALNQTQVAQFLRSRVTKLPE